MTGDFSTQFNTSLCLSSSVDCLLIANYYLTCVSIDASVTNTTNVINGTKFVENYKEDRVCY